jgi:radical SAM protein with 4Fe4S-binding SPASM domain
MPGYGYELHVTATDNSLFRVVKEKGLPKYYLGMKEYQQWHIPRIAAEYLMRCDGKTTHGEICSSLNLPFRILADRIAENLENETGVINLQDQPSKSPSELLITGRFDSFAPLHMSVEITDTCNFNCDHCYVSASPWKLGRRNYDDTITLFNTMWSNGVKVVEITGGECTIHPDFRNILAYASETFHLVAIITNGYLLGIRDGLADWVGSFDNVCVQISIDGLRDYHDEFRKKRGSFEALCVATRRLKKHGVLVRLAMSVTPENIDQVEDVFLLAKQLRADAFSAAPVTSFGRGSSFSMCAEKDHELQHAVSHILAPYADDPLFDSNRLTYEKLQETNTINCGAGWRTFALNGATGEVRSCLFLADSKEFGSVDSERFGDIFRSKYMAMFRNAPSPSFQLDICESCSYLPTCQGCFAKAFRVSETEYPKCPWRHKYFPGMEISISGSAKPTVFQKSIDISQRV